MIEGPERPGPSRLSEQLGPHGTPEGREANGVVGVYPRPAERGGGMGAKPPSLLRLATATAASGREGQTESDEKRHRICFAVLNGGAGASTALDGEVVDGGLTAGSGGLAADRRR